MPPRRYAVDPDRRGGFRSRRLQWARMVDDETVVDRWAW
jgi:hypothetical protein